jgi:protein TonB
MPPEPVSLTAFAVASTSTTARTTSKVARATRPVIPRATAPAQPSGLPVAQTAVAGESTTEGAADVHAVNAPSVAAPTAPVPFAANPVPVYPRVARRAGIEGTVVARVRVSHDGRITAIDELAGPEVFHESVREALARWRYHPATHRGRAVAVAWTLHFPFSLR